MPRVGDRRVRESLADDRNRHAVHLAHHVRLEHGIAETGSAHVLGHELDATQLFRDCFLHPGGAVGELPMTGHDIDAEEPGSFDHVPPLRPQGGGRALPAVATVEQQGSRALSAQVLYQCREVRKTTDPTETPRRMLEIDVGVSMGAPRLRRDAKVLEQRGADEMWRPALAGVYAEIDVRLAEMDRQQLRVAVGEMKQGDVAGWCRQVVENVLARRRARPAGEWHALGRRKRQQL